MEEFLEIYKKSSKSDELPNVAISDFMECATSNEFEIFRQAFEKRGITACICDIRELKYVDGILRLLTEQGSTLYTAVPLQAI